MGCVRVWRIGGVVALLALGACTGTMEDSATVAGPPGHTAGFADRTHGAGGGLAGQAGHGGQGTPGGLQVVTGGAMAGTGGTVVPPGTTDPCATPQLGPSVLRRLTHRQYANSVRDLLGGVQVDESGFAADSRVGLFDNTASAQTVSVLLAEQYLESAERIANRVDVEQLLPCDLDGPMGARCLRELVADLGARAYRRPLSSDEVDGLVDLHKQTAALSDDLMGVRAVVGALLASPKFLFRLEYAPSPNPAQPAAGPPPAGGRALDSYQLAARLALWLWSSVPDEALAQSAATGQLVNLAELERQARRMLKDPRARPAIAEFFNQWFGLEQLQTATKDPVAYPRFDEDLRAAMGEETRRLVQHVLWEGDARLSTLLTADYTFVDARLAEHYDLPARQAATVFELTDLSASPRRGLLAHASLLTAYGSPAASSPVKRGKWVRVRLLCQDLPDPPAGIPELPGPEPGVSTRERFAMHTSHVACSGCHSLIDGLGFGFEHFDGVGAFRQVDQGVEVNATGEITSTVDIDGSYVGVPELAARLAGSQQVQDCAPTQVFRYAMGRLETPEDACSLDQLKRAFAATDGNLIELMVAVTQTDAFRNYRAAR